MKYLLTIFIEHPNQNKFVESVANEISGIAKSSAIRYFFGPQVAIFTFETKTAFSQVKEFFDTILSDLSIVHILVPIKPDKMSYWFEKQHEEHLFGTDICNRNEEHSEEEQSDLIDMMYGGLNNFIEKETKDKTYQEYVQKLSSVPQEVPTLDELLDKINMSGFNSLTTDEKDLLKQYSN